MKKGIGVGVVVAWFALVGCTPAPAPPPPDTRAADEAAIRAAIEQWVAAARAKDPAGFLKVYAEDAVVMMEDAPDLRGMEALRDGITGMMQDPHFALEFVVDKVVVARSGDLAYETGAYTMTMSDPEQKPVTEKGHYAVVWEKQPDGAWKVVVDVPVSDPPPAPAAS